jgi:hypothetical protein
MGKSPVMAGPEKTNDGASVSCEEETSEGQASKGFESHTQDPTKRMVRIPHPKKHLKVSLPSNAEESAGAAALELLPSSDTTREEGYGSTRVKLHRHLEDHLVSLAMFSIRWWSEDDESGSLKTNQMMIWGDAMSNSSQDLADSDFDSGSDIEATWIPEQISDMWVCDRGEALYRAEPPLESSQPTDRESAMPVNESPKPLLDRLLRLKVRPSQSNGTFFYPRGELEALITAEEVARVIKQGRRFLEEASKVLTDHEIHEYASRVCRDTLPDGTYVSYKRAFAILLLIRRGWDIVLFVDHCIYDAVLPLKAVKVGVNELRMRHESDSETDLPCLRHWDALAHEEFEERQRSMLAPFLAKGDPGCAWFYQLSDKDVLPWTSKQYCVREGAFGTISRVKIHPSHHNFDGGNGFFAVKEFKPVETPILGTDLSKAFTREIEMLMVCRI